MHKKMNQYFLTKRNNIAVRIRKSKNKAKNSIPTSSFVFILA